MWKDGNYQAPLTTLLKWEIHLSNGIEISLIIIQKIIE